MAGFPISGALREGLKRRIGALGHAPGFAQRLRARRLASGDKRLDRVAPGLAWWIGHAIGSAEGKDCLEFGSGHLLSEALTCRIAGAARVVACDYFPILDRDAAARALNGIDRAALAQGVRAYLAAADPSPLLAGIEARLRDGDDILAAACVEYAAPLDFTAAAPFPGAFDFIHSTSVLEHVPAAQASDILANLHACLKPGGAMVHQIHLEDHRDFARAPFAFLAVADDWREADADTRGNRLRASHWLALARALPGAEVSVPYIRSRDDVALPAALHRDFAALDPADLRTANIGMVVRKIL